MQYVIIRELQIAKFSKEEKYNSVYTDYGLEDIALERKCILLKIQRNSNAKRIDTLD
ncbi:transposase, IS4 family protein [Flavobacterium columnare]|uniref:hypothetical protein n=1 Tax=Flavobacterium columnare TaxID=996 RepID=UPI0007F9F1E4|nr:hypothetical protein [Flavobacterium columnare]ANO49130.1 transposase, IS4 family protein [Flavobacterium columnare]GEM58500.1 hypothetical protein FC1_17380 [Flavobacterium columnare NBRC 100251 = ATCC 23463]